MKIVTLRHGITIWNQENRLQGQADVSLSNEGRIQSIMARGELIEGKFDIDVCYCSPLMRAAETAQIALGFLNPDEKLYARNLFAAAVMLKTKGMKPLCNIRYDKRLSERNLGRADGAPESQLVNPDATWDLISNLSIADMETVQDLYIRVSSFYHEMIAKTELEYGKDATILLVSHGGTLRILNYILEGGKLPPVGPMSVMQKDQFRNTIAYRDSMVLTNKNCQIRQYLV